MLEERFQRDPVLGEDGPTETRSLADLGAEAALEARSVEAGVIDHRHYLLVTAVLVQQGDVVGHTEGGQGGFRGFVVHVRRVHPE